jgi:hypothetical protein
MKSGSRSGASRVPHSLCGLIAASGCAVACCRSAGAQSAPRMTWQLENPQYYTASPAGVVPLILRTAPRANEVQSRIRLESSRLRGAGALRCARQFNAGWRAYDGRERRAGRAPEEATFTEIFRRRNEFCRIVAHELVPVLAFNFSGETLNYVLESIDLHISNGLGTYVNTFRPGAGPWSVDAARYQLEFSKLQTLVSLDARPFAFSPNGRVLLELSPVDYPFSDQWRLPGDSYIVFTVFHFLVGQQSVSVESEPLMIEM